MNSNDERRGRPSHRGSASVRRAGAHSNVNSSPNRDRADRGSRSQTRPATEPVRNLQGAEKYRQSAERHERPAVSISGGQRAESSYRSVNRDERASYKETQERNHTGMKNSAVNAASQRNTGRKKDNNNKNIFIILAILLVVIAAVSAFKFLSGNNRETVAESVNPNAIQHNGIVDLSLIVSEGTGEHPEAAESDEAKETSDPSKLNIKGMTLEEVRTAISRQYEWSLKVVNGEAEVGAVVKPTVDANETTEAATMGDAENPDSIISPAAALDEVEEITVADEIHIADLVALGIDRLIDEISANEQSYRAEQASLEAESETAKKKKKNETEEEKEAHFYKLELPEYETVIEEAVSKAELMWYKAPKGGGIGSYDKEKDIFVMEGAEDGYKINSEKLKDELASAISDGRYTESIHVPGEILKTDMEAVKAEYKTISSFSTKTTNNSVRNKNIKLACEMLNGTIVKPGEEFSFNDAVGERTAAKGYGAAAAYNNGEVVQEVGGGVCQLSTTLYNAVLRAGLKTTKRQSHTFKPTYVTPGWDATISWGGPDYRFANVPSREEFSNEGSYAIGIRAHYENNEVTVSIYGRPVLKEGYTYELESKKIKDIEIVRKLIEEGSDRTPTEGSMGSQWTTNLIVKKDGEIVKNEYDHKTYYSGHIQYYLEEPVTESSSDLSTEFPSDGSSDAFVTGPDGGPGVVPGGAPVVLPTESRENPLISHGDDDQDQNPVSNVETFPRRPIEDYIEIG